MSRKYRIVGIRRTPEQPDSPQVVELWRDEMVGDVSACSAKFDLMKLGFRASIFTTHEAQSEALQAVRS